MAFQFDLNSMPFEFDKCVPKCSVEQMNHAFMERLEEAYRLYPFVLNSAYRSVDWERKHHRAGTSAHCKGRAVDISTPDSRTRYYVFDALIRAGFTRFGIGKTFIHVDDDVCKTRPDRCIFLEF